MPPTNDDDSSRIDRMQALQAEDSTSTLVQNTVTFQPDSTAEVHEPSQATRPEPPLPAIPGYEIEGVLGRGGMGVVYKARHLILKRTVALKMVLAGGHAGPEELSRFRIEAEAVARLQHPHIVQIHEIGDAGGYPFCALEFVEGGNLASKLRGRPTPARDAARLVESLARAMHLAHSRNVVHRDLKPANILIAGDGTAKITDFGLARQMDSDSGQTRAGAILGTPSYMAPEQASGHAHEAGPAADVYALGALLYDCLCGRPPFKGETVFETLEQVRTQEPTAPSRLQPGLPLDLETICLKCLRKEPENRYASAAELAMDLKAFLENRPVTARPLGSFERIRKWAKRNPTLMGSIVVFLLLLAVATGLGLLMRRQSINKQNETHAIGLVDSLLNAEIARVPSIVSEMNAYRQWCRPLLTGKYVDAHEDSREKLVLALALLPIDDNQVDYLKEQLLDCTLEQFPVIRRALLPYRERLRDAMWPVLQDQGLDSPRRFQAAAALAEYARDDDRWQQTAPFVVEHLTNDILSVYLGQWRQHFQPASKALVGPLKAIHADRSRSDKQREAAAFLISDYARDQSDELIDALLVADEWPEFSLLVEAVKPHSANVKQALLAELQNPIPDSLKKNNDELSQGDQQQRDAHWNRQALAAVTLVHLGYEDEVWSQLMFSPNPSMRNLVIHYLGKLRVNQNVLAARLQTEPEVSIRRALIQSLGGLDAARMPSTDRSRIAEQLQALYVQDPDPGVHASASWSLRKWKNARPVLPVDELIFTEQQKARMADLDSEIEAIWQRILNSERELPTRQSAWEQQRREQPSDWPVSLDEGLVAHYPFDEVEGKEATNLVNGRSAGTYVGSDQPQRVPGIFSNAVRLSGNGGYFSCGEAFSFELSNSFTYGCWFLSENAKQNAALLAKMTDGERYQGYDLFLEDGRLAAHFKHEWPDNALKVVSSDPLSARSWHHVMMTYDGSSTPPIARLYVDGHIINARVDTNSLSETIQTHVPFHIGQRNSTCAFCGLIDDLRIYNRRLTEPEIQHIFESGVQSLIRIPEPDRTPEQRALLAATHHSDDQLLSHLRSQQRAAETELDDVRWKGGRWYVDRQGHTMTVVPITATDKKGPMTTVLAISSQEVTVTEFRRFRESHEIDRRIAPTDDCPVHLVSWYDAAGYCNWLSKQEGIPAEQWIYQPSGMTEGRDIFTIKPNWSELRGYRLPTAMEWETTCRSETTGTYGFGEAIPLLKSYGWYGTNSSGRSFPVGSLLPNDSGLFDMHGNVFEWTQSPGDVPETWFNVGMIPGLNGGSFSSQPSDLTSAHRITILAGYNYAYLGFRIARTLPAVTTILSPANHRQITLRRVGTLSSNPVDESLVLQHLFKLCDMLGPIRCESADNVALRIN